MIAALVALWGGSCLQQVCAWGGAAHTSEKLSVFCCENIFKNSSFFFLCDGTGCGMQYQRGARWGATAGRRLKCSAWRASSTATSILTPKTTSLTGAYPQQIPTFTFHACARERIVQRRKLGIASAAAAGRCSQRCRLYDSLEENTEMSQDWNMHAGTSPRTSRACAVCCSCVTS